MCISDDPAQAHAVMRRRVAMRVAAGYGHWDYLERLGIALPQAFVDIAARRDLRAAADASHLLPAETVERMVLAGDSAGVAVQLARALRPGVTRVIVRPHAAPRNSVGEVLRRFAEDVMPRISAAVH
jgi:hypothetical protein